MQEKQGSFKKFMATRQHCIPRNGNSLTISKVQISAMKLSSLLDVLIDTFITNMLYISNSRKI